MIEQENKLIWGEDVDFWHHMWRATIGVMFLTIWGILKGWRPI